MNLNIFYLPDNLPQKSVDVLLVTGDLFIDHPSFGSAIIARVLENKGYSVCIVSQPEYYNPAYLKNLPEVKLFIGITAGNLDSVVANYSSSRTPRKEDGYSLNGEAFFPNGQRKRPDRATIVYSHFFKQRYKDIPIVLGGLEASIRRFIHYDFVQQKLRNSILLDAKADILVYGMAEKAIVQIAKNLSQKKELFSIHGTALLLTEKERNSPEIVSLDPLELPSLQDLLQDSFLLIKQTETIEENMISSKARPLIQKQDSRYILAFPPEDPLTEEELDKLYSLPFTKDQPEYCTEVPAWNMIKNSITSHRGCYGRCSFCAITSHQGPVISSRSHHSILSEVKNLTEKPFFDKTITDIGGPTANMYGSACKIGYCKDPHCLFPTPCSNLILNEKVYKELLEKAMQIPGVKHVFVSSGLRHDLALLKPDESEFIIVHCTSGHLKIAPENTDNTVLGLMKKPDNEKFIEFIHFFEKIKKKHKLKFYILPYIILSHPGSTGQSAEEIARVLNCYDIRTRQFQDFTPVPGTLSTAMFYAKKNPDGKELPVSSPSLIKNSQRKILTNKLQKRNFKKK